MTHEVCACEWDEAGDNVLKFCLVHSNAIREAVEAERRACSEIARDKARRCRENDMYPAYCLNGQEGAFEEMARAIEARSSAEEMER